MTNPDASSYPQDTSSTAVAAASFDALWNSLLPIGQDPATGGYRRLAFTDADLACWAWFFTAAHDRGLDVETDGNGNLWAWWTEPSGRADGGTGSSSGADGGDGGDALVVGSHLDSVCDGGAFDGPLGMVSAFAALDVLRANGAVPRRPVAVVAFIDEEGARFGVACVGSGLLTGVLDADRTLRLRDDQDVTLADAMTATGHDPGLVGRDHERLARIGAYVELHIEQGRALVDTGAAIGLASGIWPHGRYRFTFAGEANHAGTTPMHDRADPLQTWARTAIAAETAARSLHARATFGRCRVVPNSTNAIPSCVETWLDARAADEQTLEHLLADIRAAAEAHAGAVGVRVHVTRESFSPPVVFDADLRAAITTVLATPDGAPVPVIPTAAGHDAGILATAGIPAAMLFVRNPTGVSHSPAEHADRDDCLAGVVALARAIARLACDPATDDEGTTHDAHRTSRS